MPDWLEGLLLLALCIGVVSLLQILFPGKPMTEDEKTWNQNW